MADASGMRFGGLWTGIIVVQVGLSVLTLPIAAVEARKSIRYQSAGLGFAADQYLGTDLSRDGEVSGMDSTGRAAFVARFAGVHHALQERLRAEPGVVAVTVATKLPATDTHNRPAIQVEGAEDVSVNVNTSAIQPGFFAAFGATVRAGRDFDVSDAESGGQTVIVNESFVRLVLGGRNAIGVRIRMAAPPNEKPRPWLDIVGVVPDLAMNAFSDDEGGAGFYEPLSARMYPLQLAIRVTGDPNAFTARLRTIAAEIDPALRVENPLSLDRSAQALQRGASFGVSAIAIIAVVALMLATVGIYALMSFTVAQRTREIGIRTALGANPGRLVRDILARAFLQLGLGALVGSAAVVMADDRPSERLWFLAAVVGIVVVVGLLACVLPVRRALRVQPTEALRA